MDSDNGDSEIRRISAAAASRYARPTIHSVRPTPQAPVLRSLEQVRPVRATNEYVDSPHLQKCGNNNLVVSIGRPTSIQHENPSLDKVFKEQAPPITQEPTSDSHSDSIICQKCHKCKCKSCTQPKELPDSWICDKTVHCSAEECINTCTCLCCVRCLFYHCFKDAEKDIDVSSADDPCACCNKPHCCARWAFLGLMSLCLPCLCFYMPARCLVDTITDCYNCCNRQGCRCRRERSTSSKRLLLESESSSS
ncbi:protein sprouty homolog 2-like [Tubulanus polymorphus]|uniref:protein sprouty homolog 2-like n=1 Tax=Tubulanus polymorphus TaxID=672921 RepID=UPI003DA2223A